MKDWKIIVIVGLVLALLVVVLVHLETNKMPADQKQAVSDLKIRIIQLEIMKKEKALTRDVLKLQREIGELQILPPDGNN